MEGYFLDTAPVFPDCSGKLRCDILVHGKYERNDMVEYFGECLDEFLFAEKHGYSPRGHDL